MNNCQSCYSENPPNAEFCKVCGSKLTSRPNTSARLAVLNLSSEDKVNIVKAALIIIVALIAWGIFKAIDSGDIKKVKNTDIGLAGIGVKITYGDLLDGYCKSVKWRKFTSNAYSNVVEFTGKTPKGEKALFQFSDEYGVHNGKYVIVYAEIGGRTVNNYELANWLMNASYSKK